MKKLALATAAAAALMFTAPAFTGTGFVTPADAATVKKVIIKKGGHHDRGRHMGRHHGGKKVVVIKRGHGHGHGKTIIKKKITHG